MFCAVWSIGSVLNNDADLSRLLTPDLWLTSHTLITHNKFVLMKNMFDIKISALLLKPEAHGPQRSPECTAMKAIFSQNTVNVACKKN